MNSLDIWNLFIQKPGAFVDGIVGIASENAIHALMTIMKRNKPLRILEIGSGIGTLTYAIAWCAKAYGLHERAGFCFYTIENESYCLKQLSQNLSEFHQQYMCVADISEIPANTHFDLIIVDGGGNLPNDAGFQRFENQLAEGGTIFVEGSRKYQRDLIREWYGDRKYEYFCFVAREKQVTNPSTGKPIKNKGAHAYKFEPTFMDRIASRIISIKGKLYRKLW